MIIKRLFIYLLFLFLAFGSCLTYMLPSQPYHYIFNNLVVAPNPFPFSLRGGDEFQKWQFKIILYPQSKTDIIIYDPFNWSIKQKQLLKRDLPFFEERNIGAIPYSVAKSVATSFIFYNNPSRLYLNKYFCSLFKIHTYSISSVDKTNPNLSQTFRGNCDNI